MRIGTVAEMTGISAQTIRFYERRGLLPDPRRDPNGYRQYDEEFVRRIDFIRSAQRTGLTLAEISGVLAVRDEDLAPCDHLTGVLIRKLDEVRERQRQLAQLKAELERLLEGSTRLDPAACTPESICQIITPQLPPRP